MLPTSDDKVSRSDEFVVLGSEELEEDRYSRRGDSYEHLAELCRSTLDALFFKKKTKRRN